MSLQPPSATAPASFVSQTKLTFTRRLQILLDRVVPLTVPRWVTTGILLVLFMTRILYIQAFYIVTYGLGIYLLNLFLAFLQPRFDPSLEMAHVSTSGGDSEATDEGTLPTTGDAEFKPFVRRLPEFKFWYSATQSILISFVLTLFPIFDIPVFWPILLVYFFVLFGLTMKRQIKHMIKYKYIPFDWNKKKHGTAKSSK